MTVRSQLDKIEDVSFAIKQIIHKGKSIEEVAILLEKRGASSEESQSIINSVLQTFSGIRRIESSKVIRIINYIADLIVVIIIVFGLVSFFTTIHSDWLIPLVIFLFPFLYYFLPELFLGQTLGKMLTGTIVVDEHGNLPDLSKIIVRTICRLIPFDNLSLILSDRILHDRISNTFVVNERRWREKYRDKNNAFK